MLEDSVETKLAQEFKDYLKIISEEISEPLKVQVDKNSEHADTIQCAVEKIDVDLRNDIKLMVKENLYDLNKQVIIIYSNQQEQIDAKMEQVNESLLKKIEYYERKTTDRLIAHRWIETLIVISIFALLLFYRNGYIPI